MDIDTALYNIKTDDGILRYIKHAWNYHKTNSAFIDYLFKYSFEQHIPALTVFLHDYISSHVWYSSNQHNINILKTQLTKDIQHDNFSSNTIISNKIKKYIRTSKWLTTANNEITNIDVHNLITLLTNDLNKILSACWFVTDRYTLPQLKNCLVFVQNRRLNSKTTKLYRIPQWIAEHPVVHQILGVVLEKSSTCQYSSEITFNQKYDDFLSYSKALSYNALLRYLKYATKQAKNNGIIKSIPKWAHANLHSTSSVLY